MGIQGICQLVRIELLAEDISQDHEVMDLRLVCYTPNIFIVSDIVTKEDEY